MGLAPAIVLRTPHPPGFGTCTAHVQVAQSEVPKMPKDWAGGNIQPFKLVSLSKLSLFLTIFVFAVYANLFQLE